MAFGSKYETLGKSIVRQVYPKRKITSRKGDFGRVLVIGGNQMFSGAPSFVGMAALKSGCDLSIIAAPKRSADIAATYSPDLITVPLEGKYLSTTHLKKLREIKCDCVVIGNGLGRLDATKRAVRFILKQIEKPFVIDGDAIHSIIEDIDSIKGKEIVFTPHKTEFNLLSGLKLTNDLDENVKHVIEFSKKYKSVIVLKGNTDIISNGEKILLNKTGNPFMTKGGTGDILAGITGGLLARKVSAFDAACCATFLTGLAGDIAAKEYQDSTTASDIINNIYKAIKDVK